MSLPRLLIREIDDLYVRENFEKLDRYFKGEHQLDGFKHFEIVFTESGSQVKYKHGLGFVPKDLLQTFIGGGTVTWTYVNFDADNLEAVVTGATPSNPVTVRAFIGSYTETP